MGLNNSSFMTTLVSKLDEKVKFEAVNVYDAVRAGESDEDDEYYFVDFGNLYGDYVRVNRMDWEVAPDPYVLPKGLGAVVLGGSAKVKYVRVDEVLWFDHGIGAVTHQSNLEVGASRGLFETVSEGVVLNG